MDVMPRADGAATEPAQAPSQPWPDSRTAWYAVVVFGLTLMFLELDRGIITLLVGPIKADLHLSDTQMSFILGFAVVAFNAIIGIPVSRFVDIWQRNVIVATGVAFWSAFTVICGFAQNFWQMFLFRMGVGIGGVAHGPACYSMMADYFPREKLPRAIAVMQVGYIAGGGLSLIMGAIVIHMLLGMPEIHLPLIGTLKSWQMVFVLVGLPGFLVAAIMMTVPEPPRRGRIMSEMVKPLPLVKVLAYLFQNWKVYLPMFLGLALGAIESLGVQAWRPTFYERTYGWQMQQVGLTLGIIQLCSAPIGLLFGTWLTEHLAKKHDDANMRVLAICYTINPLFAIAGPLMPNPWMAVACGAISFAFGLAGAVPQNAALQSVTPNEMRGQVTALYLFIFTVIAGGLGPTFIAVFTDFVIGDEQKIRYAISLSAAIMMPIAATIMWLGVKPYGREIAKIKVLERQGLR